MKLLLLCTLLHSFFPPTHATASSDIASIVQAELARQKSRPVGSLLCSLDLETDEADANSRVIESRYANLVADAMLDCAQRQHVSARIALLDPAILLAPLDASSLSAVALQGAVPGIPLTKVNLLGSEIRALLEKQVDLGRALGVSGISSILEDRSTILSASSDSPSVLRVTLSSGSSSENMRNDAFYSVITNDQLLNALGGSNVTVRSDLGDVEFLETNLYQCLVDYFAIRETIMPDWRMRSVPYTCMFDSTLSMVRPVIQSAGKTSNLHYAEVNQDAEFSLQFTASSELLSHLTFYQWIDHDPISARSIPIDPHSSDRQLFTVPFVRQFTTTGYHTLHVSVAASAFSCSHNSVFASVFVSSSATPSFFFVQGVFLLSLTTSVLG